MCCKSEQVPEVIHGSGGHGKIPKHGAWFQ
jgi:hypothetical protein